MLLSSVLVSNATSSRHNIPFVMNDSHDVLPSRGAPYTEASTTTEGVAVNPSTVPAPMEPPRADHVQVPRSPQLLSLRVDGLNAGIQDKNNHTAAYVESSERGSDTSADGQRPEPHSASTFTDSIPSLPASLSNDYEHTTVDSSHSFIENSQSSRTEPGSQNSQDSLHTLSVNGSGVDILHPLKSEHSCNGSLSPVRSPRYSTSRSGIDTQLAPRHKRTATGDIKPISAQLMTPHSHDANGASRRRSKSTGSPAHGSRIAQLSVHIRTRLSYAAAKIEKSRQSQTSSQLALRGLENLSSLDSQTTNGSASPHNSHLASHPPHNSNSSTPRPFPSHHRSQSAISSPGKLLAIPKLAPPVDIISSNGETRRRRPNPNEPMQKPAGRSPYAHHKRHHSTQELSMYSSTNGSPRVVGPGTPLIPPTSRAPTSSQEGFYGPRTQSQNTSMEQDAIETLLFMSSPENSGYRSSPRPLQPLATQRSLNESIYSNHNPVQSHLSQGSQSNGSQNSGDSKYKTLGVGLEANAGDEIDRILDQMESDSEDDARYASHRLHVKTQFRGHQGRPG
ncbi:uncharacterized protein N7473_002615 [Penicillium subrubescens]|uniref:uncharacterized protein n=1 Tax=Penicillium subrubescens TaxID=1316194 RepID=UPI0025454DAC|nr:uncharacterized protein N7473_002615 [Penicillium subrubescens]KAJ5905699.1 hypothetical protein N7473_002615 [Penicillium subrubescens]